MGCHFLLQCVKVKVKSLSRVRLLATPWTTAHQAPPSLGFSRQERWSGLPFPSPMHESEKWKVKVKSLSRVWLLATPKTAAYQAPPSMGVSKQEYWSGVPLHSPKVAQSCPTLCDPMDCTVHGVLQARILEWVAFTSPGDHPNPGIELRSPALQADSLPSEPQGKQKKDSEGCIWTTSFDPYEHKMT